MDAPDRLTDRLIRSLQVIEHTLQSKRQAFGRHIVLRRDLVDGPTEGVCAEKGLKQRVHITSRTLVLEPHVSSLFLRIVAINAEPV